MLPRSLVSPLRDQLAAVRDLHEQDLRDGLGRTKLPHALARKYPQADRELAWQWVFPASSHFTDRETGLRHRHHLHETLLGHTSVETTMIYTHVLNRGGRGVQSPLDDLQPAPVGRSRPK